MPPNDTLHECRSCAEYIERLEREYGKLMIEFQFRVLAYVEDMSPRTARLTFFEKFHADGHPPFEPPAVNQRARLAALYGDDPRVRVVVEDAREPHPFAEAISGANMCGFGIRINPGVKLADYCGQPAADERHSFVCPDCTYRGWVWRDGKPHCGWCALKLTPEEVGIITLTPVSEDSPIASYLEATGHWRVHCPKCERDCWLSPAQREHEARERTTVRLCHYCIFAEGLTGQIHH